MVPRQQRSHRRFQRLRELLEAQPTDMSQVQNLPIRVREPFDRRSQIAFRQAVVVRPIRRIDLPGQSDQRRLRGRPRALGPSEPAHWVEVAGLLRKPVLRLVVPSHV